MNAVLQRTPPTRPCDIHVLGANRLLTLVEVAGEARAMGHTEKVTLAKSDVLYRADAPITHVYFPLTGVASIIVTMENGPSVEVGTTGNEGLVGVPLLLGADRSPMQAFAQVAGDFIRMPAEVFTAELAHNGRFADVARRYAQAFFAQVAQSTACGQLHPIEQRLCRWILMTHDRVGGDTLSLTQEFLAIMLGVQRPSVTIAAMALQKAGLIRYRRGRVDVLDRVGLEASSCECYAVVRNELERLLC